MYIITINVGSSESVSWVVDPGDGKAAINALEGQRVGGALCTHHHYDHTDGIPALLDAFPECKVYGPESENIAGRTHGVSHGSRVEEDGLPEFECIGAASHTAGHVMYYAAASGDLERPVLFCGDALFSVGCGRFFEGDEHDMAEAVSRLSSLPDDTLVCCGHEYTLSNIKFARGVDPDNEDLKAWEVECKRRRESLSPTVPTTLGHERRVNPFLRAHDQAIQQKTGETEPHAVIGVLRKMKDAS